VIGHVDSTFGIDSDAGREDWGLKGGSAVSRKSRLMVSGNRVDDSISGDFSHSPICSISDIDVSLRVDCQ
jgi:hypothetical protein